MSVPTATNVTPPRTTKAKKCPNAPRRNRSDWKVRVTYKWKDAKEHERIAAVVSHYRPDMEIEKVLDTIYVLAEVHRKECHSTCGVLVWSYSVERDVFVGVCCGQYKVTADILTPSCDPSFSSATWPISHSVKNESSAMSEYDEDEKDDSKKN